MDEKVLKQIRLFGISLVFMQLINAVSQYSLDDLKGFAEECDKQENGVLLGQIVRSVIDSIEKGGLVYAEKELHGDPKIEFPPEEM